MIAQVLNRSFVLSQLRTVRDALDDPASESSVQPQLSEDDIETAKSLIDETLASERANSSGQQSNDDHLAGRRGDEGEPIEDVAYISQDRIISLFQSSLEEYLFKHEDVRQVSTEIDMRRGTDSFIPVAEFELANAPFVEDVDENRRIMEKFSLTDPRWLACGFPIALRFLRQDDHAFNYQPPQPSEIRARARLILLGDWGSGLPRARNVAAQAREIIDFGMQEGLEQHVVHMGDVYYSGLRREYDKRFLPYWPVKSTESATLGSWSLNGNHEMYSGGYAYFDHLLKDQRFQKQGGCSYFNLFNDFWEIIGLDTAHESHTLNDEQVDWVKRRMKNHPKRKLLLLSHHQPFSAYAKGGELLLERLKDVICEGRVTAWFWGHEHRCLMYKPHANINFGSCVGHAGIPEYMPRSVDDPYPDIVEYEYRNSVSDNFTRWTYFGFAVLEIDGPMLNVRYIDENGDEHYTKRIVE